MHLHKRRLVHHDPIGGFIDDAEAVRRKDQGAPTLLPRAPREKASLRRAASILLAHVVRASARPRSLAMTNDEILGHLRQCHLLAEFSDHELSAFVDLLDPVEATAGEC